MSIVSQRSAPSVSSPVSVVVSSASSVVVPPLVELDEASVVSDDDEDVSSLELEEDEDASPVVVVPTTVVSLLVSSVVVLDDSLDVLVLEVVASFGDVEGIESVVSLPDVPDAVGSGSVGTHAAPSNTMASSARESTDIREQRWSVTGETVYPAASPSPATLDPAEIVV